MNYFHTLLFKKIKIRKMKHFLTCILALLGLNACGQNFENADVKEFAELMNDSNVVVLDVRTADEFNEAHIKGAINIDQFKSDFIELAKQQLPKDKTIAVYCRSGRRSKEAAQKLYDMGYTNVYEFGGIIDWTGEVVTG